MAVWRSEENMGEEFRIFIKNKTKQNSEQVCGDDVVEK